MACKYVYYGNLSEEELAKKSKTKDVIERDKSSGKIEYIVAKSVEEISDILLANSSDLDLFNDDPDLLFYKADLGPKEEIWAKLNKIKKEEPIKGKPGEDYDRVTTICEENFGKKYEGNSGTPEVLLEFIKDFSTNLGTLIHEAILNYKKPDSEKHILAVLDYIVSVANDSDRFEQLRKAVGPESNLLSEYNYPAKYNKLLHNALTNIDELRGSLLETIQQMYRGAHGLLDNALFELEVKYTDPLGRLIVGHLDAVTVDDDGTVIIYDFKSSASDHKSKSTAAKHYALLYMYKRMLANYGIPAKKIKIYNGFINVSSGLIKAVTFNNDKTYIKLDSSMTGQNPANFESEIMTRLRHKFPLSNEGYLLIEQLKLREKITKAKRKLFTESSLNKDDVELYTNFLLKYKKEDPYYSEHLGESYKIEVVEDTIKFYSINNGKFMQSMNLSEFVQKELSAQADNKHNLLEDFKLTFEDKDAEALQAKLTSRFGRNINLVHTMGHYLSPEWTVIDNPLLEDLGILVFYNTADHCYDFVNLIAKTKLFEGYKLHDINGDSTLNVLGNICSPDSLRRYRDGDMEANNVNIAYLNTLLAISLAKDSLLQFDGGIKIGSINVVSTITGNASLIFNPEKHITLFKIINAEIKKGEYKIEEAESFEEALENLKTFTWAPEIDQVALRLRDIIYGNELLDEDTTNSYINSINDATNPNRATTLGEKLQALKDLRSAFTVRFANELATPDKFNDKNTSPTAQIDMLLARLIAAYEGLTTDEVYETSRMGLEAENTVKSAWSLLRYGSVGKFNANGAILTGFMLGLSSATPYAIPDDTVRLLATLHSFGTTRIQMQAEKYIDNQNQHTARWLQAKKSYLGALFNLSNNRDLYYNLFKKDKDGNLDPAYRFKNPFNDADKQTLGEEDILYLKVSLWNLVRIKCVDNTKFSENIRLLTFDELSDGTHNIELQNFENYLNENPSALNIPLRTATSGRIAFGLLKALLKRDTAAVKEYWQHKLEKSRTWWDPSGLSDRQLNEREEKQKALQAYNMYNESEVIREKRLQNGVDAFEFNINFLVNDYIYNYVSVKVNLDILDITDRMIATLRYTEMITGKDLSPQIEEIKKRTNISIYNTDNVKKDYRDLTNLISHLRSLVNLGAIAFRPLLMAKELVTGRVKNYLYSSLGYFATEGITPAIMARAEAIVFGEGIVTEKLGRMIGRMKPGDRSKVEQLNYLYRIANMDANIVSLKSAVDNNETWELAYYTNTRPDWYNRMAIFVAKMIADGTWDAYELNEKTGKLEYHMEKDKRYEIYLKYKNNPPEKSNPDYSKYNEQKARYIWSLNTFIKSNVTNPDGSILKEGDLLPIAYNNLEINSIKEIIGTLYGFFNHEEHSSWQTETYSKLFMKFKTYMAGELKHYFALPGSKTSHGKLVQKTDGIPTEEYPDGTPVYEKYDKLTDTVVYVTNRYNDDGSENNIVYDWTADSIEGIAVSFAIVCHDIFTEKGRADLRRNPARIKRALMFLFRLLAQAIAAGIMALIVKDKLDKREIKRLAKQMAVLKKASDDLGFFSSVVAPIDDLNLVGVEYIENTAINVGNAIVSKDFSKLASSALFAKDWIE